MSDPFDDTNDAVSIPKKKPSYQELLAFCRRLYVNAKVVADEMKDVGGAYEYTGSTNEVDDLREVIELGQDDNQFSDLMYPPEGMADYDFLDK